MILDPIPLAVTALDSAALSLVIGVAAVAGYLRPPPTALPRTPLWLGVGLLVVTGLADLLLRTAALADVGLGEAWPYLGRAITHSDYGSFWLLRVAAWFTLLGLAIAGTQRAADGRIAAGIAGCAALLVFAVSATGHAGDGGALTTANLINSLHVAAACVWGGAVAVYIVLLPRLRRATPAATLALSATRLSALAGAALAAVLATGVYNAWRQLPEWSALWDTDYGRALLVKLAGVGLMMGIGAANRFFLVPAVEQWAQRGAQREPGDGTGAVALLLRVLRIDTAVFAGVLACAAVLGAQTPPAHATNDGDGATTGTAAATRN